MHKKYHVSIRKGEDGFYVAECLDLPGCISQGKTKDEARKNIHEAILVYLETLREHHMPKPQVETIII